MVYRRDALLSRLRDIIATLLRRYRRPRQEPLEGMRRCFSEHRVLYTQHARQEMRLEEFGAIREQEVFEAVHRGEIIERYDDDEPYPSVLVYGRTERDRPIHVVCAHAAEDDRVIVITVYEPDPARWIDYRRRRT